ncbi:MAG: HEPN domain-containing protein [Chloroflexi bacterium]|nr:HEPN domain-containing protein [Chloroflexota bacterium]
MLEAERDIEHARQDRDTGYHNRACFSAQQAAQEAVKAVFQRLGAEVWAHSVTALLGESKDGRPAGSQFGSHCRLYLTAGATTPSITSLPSAMVTF